VPQGKRNRFATPYRPDQQGELVADGTAGTAPSDYGTQPTMASGGGGMVSTAQDYLRFAQNAAEWRRTGRRVDSDACHGAVNDRKSLGASLMNNESELDPTPGLEWGFDCAVFLGPAASGWGGRQGYVLLARSGGHVVLGAPHERPDFCGDDAANAWTRVAGSGSVEPTRRVSCAGETEDVRLLYFFIQFSRILRSP
jgi:hypothetical protein